MSATITQQTLADLTTAVSNLGSVVATVIAAKLPTDDAAVEAQIAQINTLAAELHASIPATGTVTAS